MAALLVGCFAVLTSKLSVRSRERREREREYNSNFEVLKEENAKRVRHLSKTSYHEHAEDPAGSQHSGSVDGGGQQGMAEMTRAPPSYDDVAGGRGRPQVRRG